MCRLFTRTLEASLRDILKDVDSVTIQLVGDKASGNVLLQKKLGQLVEALVEAHGFKVLVTYKDPGTLLSDLG